MSNGGYKGSTPARETSPEQYPGVWELTEQFQAQADGNWPFQATDCAPKSLRFDGSSAYLSRTPTANSNRRTFTWSGWVKRAKLSEGGSYYPRLFATARTTDKFEFNFMHDDTLRLELSVGAVVTTQVFRDISSFYHIVLAVDTTEGSNSDRVKMYINGERVTSFSSYDSISQNFQTGVNTTQSNAIGRYEHSSSEYFDGGISEVHFIDGQALSCEEFGFFDGQGIWQPKRFTGDYASGPVYSNFITASNGGFHAAPYHQPAGFNNVIGTGSAGYVQAASGSNPNNLTFTPSSGIPYTNSVEVYIINAANTVTVNGGSAQTISANQWVTVASGSGVLTSLKFERPSTSGASFSGIKIDGQLLQDASVGRNSFHLDFSDGVKDQSGVGNDWTANNIALPSSIGVTATVPAALVSGTWTDILNKSTLSGASVVMRDGGGTNDSRSTFFYSGMTVGDTITWYGASVAGENPQTRNCVGDISETTCSVPGYGSPGSIDLTVTATSGSIKIDFNGDATCYGITPGISSETDSLVDSPVNGNQTDPSGLGGIIQGNYAVLNPLTKSVATLSKGNLLYTTHSSTQHCVGSTFAVTSGKWYWEYTIESAGTYHYAGIADANTPFTTNWCGSSTGWTVAVNTAGNISYNHTENNGNIGSSPSSGQVWGWALDMDAGTLKVYVNGVIQYSGNSIIPSSTSLSGRTITPAVGHYQHKSLTFNYGQRPYKYQNAGTDRPSADYKSLCTTNLPEPSIPVPSHYFDTKLWSGNNGTQAITGYNFAPSFAWVKQRNSNRVHTLYDSIRGVTKFLISNNTASEYTSANSLTSFDSNGFSLGSQVEVNALGGTYAGWAWASDDATTTTAVNSIRAVQNVTAGNNFSAGWAGFNQSFWANTDSWSNLPARNGNAKGYWPNTETLSDGHVFNSPDFGSISSGTGGHVLRASSSCTLKFTVYSHITEIAITTSDSQTFADRTIIATNPTANSIVEATGKCFWFSTTSAVPNIGAMGTVNNAPALPSLASTVRSSPESGFSITKWTGNGTNGATVAHNLSGAENGMIIVKNATSTLGPWWAVYHTSLTPGKVLGLNSSQGEFDETYLTRGIIENVTPSTFTCTSGSAGSETANGNGDEHIAYAWAPIEGFSSFGSFENPSSSQGAFVALGFKPELLIIKCAKNISSSSSSGDWIIKDLTRSPFNNPSDGNTLVANVDNAEDNYYGGGQAAIDILSNGFKIRHPNSSPAGDPGRLYIYAAWAKSPFKNARAQ